MVNLDHRERKAKACLVLRPGPRYWTNDEDRHWEEERRKTNSFRGLSDLHRIEEHILLLFEAVEFS